MQLYLFDFHVAICEPLVHISAVLPLNTFEGVNIVVNFTVHKRHLVFAFVDFEITIDKRESSPTHGNIFWPGFAGKINQLKNKNIRWDKLDIWRQNEINLMSFELEFAVFIVNLIFGVIILNICVLFSKINPNMLNIAHVGDVFSEIHDLTFLSVNSFFS